MLAIGAHLKGIECALIGEERILHQTAPPLPPPNGNWEAGLDIQTPGMKPNTPAPL